MGWWPARPLSDRCWPNGTAEAQSPQAGGVNRNSAPSQLRITDMRAIRIATNFDYPIIRVDTNQGVYGLGELRDAGNEGMALLLKPHIVGQNPLNIEPILDSVRNFAGQRRFGGGYSALDMALHDISGKVFGVPAWRLLGSQYRDRVRCYCDTVETDDPKTHAARFAARKKMGYTFFKMDLRPWMIRKTPGAVNSRGVANHALTRAARRAIAFHQCPIGVTLAVFAPVASPQVHTAIVRIRPAISKGLVFTARAFQRTTATS